MSPFVMGLSGLSGAGKTFYIQALQKMLGNQLCVLSFDDYYKAHHLQAKDANGVMNFDLPSALETDLFVTHLNSLINGISITKEKYQFELENPVKVDVELKPAAIILVEGLFIFEEPEINKLLTYKIFLECDEAICLQRRLERDVNERGIPKERSLYQWQNHVLPAFNKYIAPYKNSCNVTYTNIGNPNTNLLHLISVINENSLHKI